MSCCGASPIGWLVDAVSVVMAGCDRICLADGNAVEVAQHEQRMPG
jgi:hypothetical protein